MKNNSYIILAIIILFIHCKSNGQNEEKCLKRANGYVYKIYQKSKDKYESVSMDYFFSKENIDIKIINSPFDFLNLGCSIINKNYIPLSNLEMELESDIFKRFDQGEPYSSIKKNNFIIEKYRVCIFYSLIELPLSDYIKNSDWSRNHSYFINMEDNKKEIKYIFINPEMIIQW